MDFGILFGSNKVLNFPRFMGNEVLFNCDVIIVLFIYFN